MQTNCGGEVGGGICKSVGEPLPPTLLQIPPPTSPPQLVCTVCTERLVCTRYVPIYIGQSVIIRRCFIFVAVGYTDISLAITVVVVVAGGGRISLIAYRLVVTLI